jgi:hypothetical protein
MIDVIALYQDVARDDANKSENGNLSYDRFNRLLKRAELNLLKYLTGDLIVDAADFPSLNSTQKNKDYLKRFIVKHKANGDFYIPENYYGYENLYKINGFIAEQEDEDEEEVGCELSSENKSSLNDSDCNIQIDIMDGQAFYNRCSSYIKSLRPSYKKPIAKIVDNRIEMQPSDIGSVCLEYIRYPKYGSIKTKIDSVRNDVIADAATSTNCEWDEWAREYLIWFCVNKFSGIISNKSMKENNYVDKPRG